MKSKANKLMFPDSDGMAPPTGLLVSPGKKRGQEVKDGPDAKRKASSDTNSPPTTPDTPTPS